jgi:hypothetical protein
VFDFLFLDVSINLDILAGNLELFEVLGEFYFQKLCFACVCTGLGVNSQLMRSFRLLYFERLDHHSALMFPEKI